jgi:superfamily II DNA/RNA helicase
VCRKSTNVGLLLIAKSGRTGRFGRKGISINFVHDQKTWLQMEQIEKALGKKIMRIETNDLDEMEEVSILVIGCKVRSKIQFVENEASTQIVAIALLHFERHYIVNNPNLCI